MDTLIYQNVHQTQNNIFLQPNLLLIKFVSLINHIINYLNYRHGCEMS